MDSQTVFATLTDYIDGWKRDNNDRLGHTALKAMVNSAIREESILMLLQVAKTLPSPAGKRIVDGISPTNQAATPMDNWRKRKGNALHSSEL